MQQNTTQDKRKPRRRKNGGGELTGRRLGVLKSSLDFAKFSYRWINDAPGRIHAKTIEDDWEIVGIDGAIVETENANAGSAKCQVVGVKPDGSAMVAYLCRKWRDYFDDDQKEKSKELDEQLDHLRRGLNSGGGAQADYIPSEGINMS